MNLEGLTTDQLDRLHRRLGAALREIRLVRDRMRELHWDQKDFVYQGVHKSYLELESACIDITRFRKRVSADEARRLVNENAPGR